MIWMPETNLQKLHQYFSGNKDWNTAGPKPKTYRRNSQALYPLESFSARFWGGRPKDVGQNGVIWPTKAPCSMNVCLSASPAQSHVDLSSCQSHVMVPLQRLSRRSVRFRQTKCMRSAGNIAGTPRTCEEPNPPKIEGLHIPVSRQHARYSADVVAPRRCLRFVWYLTGIRLTTSTAMDEITYHLSVSPDSTCAKILRSTSLWSQPGMI